MPSPVSVLIPIKSHHKAYLTTLYGTEPIAFPKKHIFNRFLIQHIHTRPLDVLPDVDREGKIEIFLPYNPCKNVRVHNYLSRESMEDFRKLINWEFSIDFREFIRAKIEDGFKRKDATLLFMDLYKISEDDISFSAFYRDYSRQIRKRHAKYSESDY